MRIFAANCSSLILPRTDHDLEAVKRSPTTTARTLRKHDTWAEKLLWKWLRDRRFSQYKFRRQHPYGAYILDFYCIEASLNIELDGFQHGSPEHLAKDGERDRWLTERGVKVLRFWNSRLRREPQAIRDTIWRALQERSPHPLPDYCRPINPPENETSGSHFTPPCPSP
ncbi:MAG TPA: DUF559 domain-containing protein [Roseimicrobium sp.]|nr:DUF559 domain-containing protein [Roseimicrobium sp.]